MEVNEKCDVYSFGVVTLEIVMGRHPGDLISSLSSPLLPSTSSASPDQHDQVALEDVLDQRISPPTQEEAGELVTLAKLAFTCLNGTPQCRPAMKQISQETCKGHSL